ncbi:hypothetical protein L0B53_18845 (plasmid) [Vibrio sp. SS-MA-C1-2]|uniref:hypothetical protein n=1 Tax=Vibrio sp. SS-MA-C1-2 TaxID=2908646 RepID=UPI001F26B33F|nr:hypothetical protein [Vibrio sp. SS-MA-C1-2]UJF20196.1 hypothetical protein L0B53_18845 [Vibrio sp. SS-MA-C1-2]
MTPLLLALITTPVLATGTEKTCLYDERIVQVGEIVTLNKKEIAIKKREEKLFLMAM